MGDIEKFPRKNNDRGREPDILRTETNVEPSDAELAAFAHVILEKCDETCLSKVAEMEQGDAIAVNPRSNLVNIYRERRMRYIDANLPFFAYVAKKYIDAQHES